MALLGRRFLVDQTSLALIPLYIVCFTILLVGFFRFSFRGHGFIGFITYPFAIIFTFFLVDHELFSPVRALAEDGLMKDLIGYLASFFRWMPIILLICGIAHRTGYEKSVVAASAITILLLMWLGYHLTSDFRERERVLRPLVAANAPLDDVLRKSGKFKLFRIGTPEWTNMLSYYQRGSDWDIRIARKIESTSAMGHHSTMYMQTWIFLDEQDRLVDFELGSQ